MRLARPAATALAAATVALAPILAPVGASASPQNPTYAVRGVASNDVLWIRSGPSTRFRKIGSIPHNGRGVRMFGCEGRWCQVRYRGVTGWSHGRHLDLDY